MSRRATVTGRLCAVGRIAARQSHARISRHWVAKDPLPLFRLYLHLYSAVTGRAFTDAAVFETIEIDPQKVTHVSNRAKGWNSLIGEVVGGEWDQRSVPIDEVPIVGIIFDHVRAGEPLDCARYRQYYTQERRRLDPFGVRCERLQNLVWDISQQGYLSQRELLEREDVYALQGQNNDTVHPLLNEIRVDIDRTGGFHHWRCGLHRLAIAQALGIEHVPVLVGTRHAEWQAVRDEFRRASSVDDLPEAVRCYVGHPDLHGLVTDSESESKSRSNGTSGAKPKPNSPPVHARRMLLPLVERLPPPRHAFTGGEERGGSADTDERCIPHPGRSA